MASNKLHSALRWQSITPSNAATLEPVPVAVFVGVAGDVAMVGDDGTAVTFAVPAGYVLQCQPHKVMATGTTATGIVGLYN